MFNRKKKDLVNVQISVTVEVAKLNEFKNRVASLASPYSEGDYGLKIQTPRGDYRWC